MDLAAEGMQSRSRTSTGAEEDDIAAADADDEQSDDDDVDVEGAPIGPLPDDLPVLYALPEEDVYCTSCHQNVRAIRFNVCPKCTCTDSTLPLDHMLTKMCRDSEVVSEQYI